MTNTFNSSTSPLIQRITEAIKRCQPRQGALRVSVAREPKWEKSKLPSDEVLVRWMCWSLEDGEVEIVPPEFEVLHPDITEEILKKELPKLFPSLNVVVDNDIDV